MLNKTDLRESVKSGLYARASALLEAYTDDPMGIGRPITNPMTNTLVNTWRVYKDPNWDFNMKRPEVGEGIEDGDNFYNGVYNNLANSVSPSFLKLAKAAYFLDESEAIYDTILEAYDESVPHIVIDSTDADDTDTQSFIASLHRAAQTDSVIELVLDDGSEVDLDLDTIRRLIAEPDLVAKLLSNLDSLYDIATVLNIDIDEESDVDNEGEDLEESEVDEVTDILNEKAESYIESLFEDDDIAKMAMAQAAAVRAANNARNTRTIGKIKKIRRAIRNGRIVTGLERSVKKGWKIVSGKIVKMCFAEKRNRKLAARITVRKNKAKASIAAMRRARSDAKRHLLGL